MARLMKGKIGYIIEPVRGFAMVYISYSLLDR
jgi:hypothetical protein